MAYFDTGKIADTATSTDARSIFDRLVKFIATRATAITTRPGISPKQIVAAQKRAEAHRRAVDKLMR
ncbi:hypothetical protein [Marivita sp. XM-24bin2]|jgi:hypothetical protein|uniref:hypothetical protein n=1 Tax=unclassified Marivita TaxID=2632480 RepID=UPI000D796E89|nr:hypothetical protein [Marivita sp. XM-24bin2]MCR9107343.1 hypothetical protein [Paracoccaceae bacterium]PWL36537.1 MAG: hypothetical protein DCO97_03385 [Marivita sp. XM-24bin2]